MTKTLSKRAFGKGLPIHRHTSTRFISLLGLLGRVGSLLPGERWSDINHRYPTPPKDQANEAPYRGPYIVPPDARTNEVLLSGEYDLVSWVDELLTYEEYQKVVRSLKRGVKIFFQNPISEAPLDRGNDEPEKRESDIIFDGEKKAKNVVEVICAGALSSPRCEKCDHSEDHVPSEKCMGKCTLVENSQCGRDYSGGDEAKKSNVRMVCPKAGSMFLCQTCYHASGHDYMAENCDHESCGGGACIPVAEKTSDVGGLGKARDALMGRIDTTHIIISSCQNCFFERTCGYQRKGGLCKDHQFTEIIEKICPRCDHWRSELRSRRHGRCKLGIEAVLDECSCYREKAGKHLPNPVSEEYISGIHMQLSNGNFQCIDEHIREEIRALNKTRWTWNHVCTVMSCEGHENGNMPYVTLMFSEKACRVVPDLTVNLDGLTNYDASGQTLSLYFEDILSIKNGLKEIGRRLRVLREVQT